MLDDEFARTKFVADGDPQERCIALSSVLTERLRAAANSDQAVEWMMAELRRLGHLVTRWDEIVSDAWSEPQNDTYLWIALGAGDDASDSDADVGEARWDSAAVSFRPRLRDLPKRCPQCFSTMSPCDIRLRVQGHGSASAPALRVRFESPGLAVLDVLVGPESLEACRGGFSCDACGAAWFPPMP